MADIWARTSGSIEITLALHRVFHSPDDVILWDTGHQAYVHKLLTGRPRSVRPRCARRAGSRAIHVAAESEHDWIENSHASTVVSYAHGFSTAMAQRGESTDMWWRCSATGR